MIEFKYAHLTQNHKTADKNAELEDNAKNIKRAKQCREQLVEKRSLLVLKTKQR